MHPAHPIRATLVLALAILTIQPASAAPSVEIAVPRKGDRATLTEAGTAATISITSETGIGFATLTRSGEAWPRSITLHLQLRGLESLVIDDGESRLQISAGQNRPDTSSHQTISINGFTDRLEREHPLWSHVKADGVTFTLTIPPQLLGRDSLTIRWIDFYRD